MRGQHDAERQAGGERASWSRRRAGADPRGRREVVDRAAGGVEPLGVRHGRGDQHPEVDQPGAVRLLAAPWPRRTCCSVSIRDDGRFALRTEVGVALVLLDDPRGRAQSIGRYSSVTRLRSMSRCGRSSRAARRWDVAARRLRHRPGDRVRAVVTVAATARVRRAAGPTSFHADVRDGAVARARRRTWLRGGVVGGADRLAQLLRAHRPRGAGAGAVQAAGEMRGAPGQVSAPSPPR